MVRCPRQRHGRVGVEAAHGGGGGRMERDDGRDLQPVIGRGIPVGDFHVLYVGERQLLRLDLRFGDGELNGRRGRKRGDGLIRVVECRDFLRDTDDFCRGDRGDIGRILCLDRSFIRVGSQGILREINRDSITLEHPAVRGSDGTVSDIARKAGNGA